MKLKIGTQENFKNVFTVDEVNAIAEMKKDNFPEINENGIQLSDFTTYTEDYVLKISAEFCKHENTKFFSDDRLNDIDIYINVVFYDGFTFSDEHYYYSDFMMRTFEDGFKKTAKTATVK